MPDKRKMPRHSGRQQNAQIQWPAHQPSPCRVSDLSDTGARLGLASNQDIPDLFTLSVPGHPAMQRDCRVVWRSRSHIGVRFEKRFFGIRRSA